MLLVEDLYSPLNNKLGNEFVDDSSGLQVSIEFSHEHYYNNVIFIIEFFIDVTEKIHDHLYDVYDEKMSGNQYIFAIKNGQIVSRLYRTYYDPDNFYKEQESTHMNLVKSKEAELIDFIINYNELSLLFSSGHYLTQQEIRLLKWRYSDYERLLEKDLK